MRSIHFKAMIAGLALIGWAAGTNNGTAQFFFTGQKIPSLLTLTNTWHYNATATNFNANPSLGGLGTAWKLPGYFEDPSLGWDVGGLGPTNGLGLFGFPNPAQLADWPPGFRTLFPDPVPQVPYVVTYYYRTHFNFPTNPANITLTITNWIDDGAVYWLNGTELGRLRVAANLTGTNLNYKTLATANTDAPIPDVLIVDPTNLVAGDNLIAAEVHQQSLTSSDDAFGIEAMDAYVAQSLVITNQPQSKTAIIGHPVTLTVGGTGSFPFYYWYRVTTNTTLVASGPTNYFFTIASAQLANQGTYYVTVSNRLGKVTSSNAVLTVVPDTFGPLLLSATVNDTNAGLISVAFDENVNRASATNLADWTLTLLGTTNQVQITNAVYANSVIRLSLASPLSTSNKYVLTVNNVRDNTANLNIIAPNSWIGVSFSAISNIFDMNYTWRYDTSEMSDPDPSWKSSLKFIDDPAVNFNWAQGPGLFAYSGTGIYPSCAPVGTSFGGLGSTTFYLRTKFNLATNFGPNPTFRLTYVVDDGAVFYLNGAEVLRVNMPAGQIFYNTVASGSVTATTCRTAATNLGPGILVKGTNLLAVELHYSGQTLTDQDMSVGAAVAISNPITPTLPADPTNAYKLHIQRPDPNDPNTVNLWWGNTHGFALEAVNDPSPNSRWIQVPNMATNMLISVTNAMPVLGTSSTRFYRLHKVD